MLPLSVIDQETPASLGVGDIDGYQDSVTPFQPVTWLLASSRLRPLSVPRQDWLDVWDLPAIVLLSNSVEVRLLPEQSVQ